MDKHNPTVARVIDDPQGMAHTLYDLGYRAIPRYTNRDKSSEWAAPFAGKRSTDRSKEHYHPQQSPAWQNATRAGIALDNLLLVDFDIYGEENPITPAMLAEHFGISTDAMESALFQWNDDKTSIHYLFQWPTDFDPDVFFNSRDHILKINGCGGVDLKTHNQLAWLKPGKHFRYIRPDQLPIATASLIDFFRRPVANAESIQRSAEARTVTTGDNNYGDVCLQNACDEIRSTATARNVSLNKIAFKIGAMVAGGYIQESTARYELESAALSIVAANFPTSEARGAVNSGFTAGLKKPFIKQEGGDYQKRWKSTPEVDAKIPIYKINDISPTPAILSYPKELKALLAVTDHKAAASVALGICYRFLQQTPAFMTVDKLTTDVFKAAHGLIHPVTMTGIHNRLTFINQMREEAALASVTISDSVKARHNYRVIKDLLDVDITQQGIIFVKAGQAAGKTSKIGVPLSRNAKNTDSVFMAFCHRQSLTRELSRVLETEHYQEIDPKAVDKVRSVSTCINSIINEKLSSIAQRVEVLFGDEISQTLRSIGSKGGHMKNPDAVLDTLTHTVQQADRVVLCDADINSKTIEAFEAMRPGEQFTIYEILPPANNGMTVRIINGKNPKSAITGAMFTAQEQGAKCILATDSKTQTKILTRAAETFLPNAATLGIHSDNAENNEQRAFLADADERSAAYNILIHSPTISSGVSIQNTVFHRGFGLFHGVTPPADSIQMMRRGRTIKEWDIAILPNNANVGRMANPDLIIQALEAVEQAECSDFDKFVACQEAMENAAKLDYAGGLYWQLQRLGFTVEIVEDDSDHLKNELVEIRDELIADQVQRILKAAHLTTEQYRLMAQESTRTEEQAYQLARYLICRDFGTDNPTEEDVLNWDDGRGAKRLRLFMLATGEPPKSDDREGALILRQNQEQKAEYLKGIMGRLFGSDGSTLYLSCIENRGKVEPLEFSKETSTSVVDYCCANALQMVYLGLIPGTVIKEIKGKSAHSGFSIVRPKCGVRFVKQILERVGLDVGNGKRIRNPGTKDSKGRNNLERTYAPTEKSLEMMATYAAQVKQKRAEWLEEWRRANCSTAPDMELPPITAYDDDRAVLLPEADPAPVREVAQQVAPTPAKLERPRTVRFTGKGRAITATVFPSGDIHYSAPGSKLNPKHYRDMEDQIRMAAACGVESLG